MKGIKRICALALCFLMVVALIPTTALAAEPGITNLSAAPEVYDLWVNGTQVTSDNAANVLSDGTVSYDAGTKTLTLNGANLTNAGHTGYSVTAAVFADSSIGTLTVNSMGQNTISVTDDGITAGIYGYGDIIFTGAGSLTVTGSSTGSEGNAIYAHTGNVIINSGTYHFTGQSANTTGWGIFPNNNSGTVTVNGGTSTFVGQGDETSVAFGGTLDVSSYTGCSIVASRYSDGSDPEDYNASESPSYKYIRIWHPEDAEYDENGFEIGGPGYQPAELVDGVY